MSDSDNDLLPSNVFSFRNENTTVCARGPNINTTLTGINYRNKIASSMHTTRDFERQQYLEPASEQRNTFLCRRDTSPPMSLHSSDFRPRSFQHSLYSRGISCQRSMINGRSGSPMSVRSIDSNASVATDIAMALKNVNFNKYDFKVIKEAYSKFLKRNSRKRVEKRRNRRLFLRGHRRKSGNDSVGSDSSISEDDYRSTSTAMYKDNMSSCRSTRTDLSEFRQSMKETNLYDDRTDSIRQNSFRNVFHLAPRTTSTHIISKEQVISSGTLKDRFRTGFLLPSQRFNQSLASVSIPERRNILGNNYSRENHRNAYNQTKTAGHDMHETDSEQEEIFPTTSLREKSIQPQSTNVIDKRKRCLESSEYSLHKRSKLMSPKRNETIVPSQKKTDVLPKDNKNAKEFQFIKPQAPVRKSGNSKPEVVKEKLLPKSVQPLNNILPSAPVLIQIPAPDIIQTEQSSKFNSMTLTKDQNHTNDHSDDMIAAQLSTSDVSMRPSFIKRKLYSQKLDVMENKNLSNDNIGADSPQTNIYSAIQKEKNRARKLVTNLSCLSRDVQQEDNNLLDLIHKIVPPERINITSKTDVSNNNSKHKGTKDDKWDVSSIISTCNNDDVSDTYTDEEIFKVDNNKIKKTKKPEKSEKKSNDSKILAVKLPHNKEVLPLQFKLNTLTEKKDANKKGNVYNCVKSFWDTDLESDLENNGAQDWNQKENFNQGNFSQNKSLNRIKGLHTDSSKVLPNGKTNTTLTSNNIISHIKKLNVSLSLMKKTKVDGNRVEHCQSKETIDSSKSTKCNVNDKLVTISNNKKVLDTHDALSNIAHHDSINKANNTKGTPRSNKNIGGKNKKHENDSANKPKRITESNQKSTRAITNGANNQVKKNTVSTDKLKIQSPKTATEAKGQESKKPKETERVTNKSSICTKPSIKKVLDTHDSSSNIAQHNSVVKSNNTKGTPQSNKNIGRKNKKHENDCANKPKRITESNKKTTKAITNGTKNQVKKIIVNTDKLKMQSPKTETETKSQESEKKRKGTERVTNKLNICTKPSIQTELVAKPASTRRKKTKLNLSDVTQNESIDTNTRITRLSASKSMRDSDESNTRITRLSASKSMRDSIETNARITRLSASKCMCDLT